MAKTPIPIYWSRENLYILSLSLLLNTVKEAWKHAGQDYAPPRSTKRLYLQRPPWRKAQKGFGFLLEVDVFSGHKERKVDD